MLKVSRVFIIKTKAQNKFLIGFENKSGDRFGWFVSAVDELEAFAMGELFTKSKRFAPWDTSLPVALGDNEEAREWFDHDKQVGFKFTRMTNRGGHYADWPGYFLTPPAEE